MAKSAEQWKKKFKTGISQGGDSWVEGVKGVRVSPMQKAAENVDKWWANLVKAKDENRFVDGCNAVPLGEWQAKTTEAKGNYQNSATKASEGYSKYASKAAPEVARFSAEIDAMPSTTDQDNEQRAVEMIRKMRTLKGISRR